MPRPTLPIDDVLPQICKHLEDAANLVIAAPPGAGKTTRVPLALVDSVWRGSGKILMLEPRRIAARAAAERLAEELGEKPGNSVGYRIRGEGKPGRIIEVVTEGILTSKLQDDPELTGVSAVIFDEAHERAIHSELGLALALDVQDALRPDLRIIVMSATLNTAAYARLLDDAAVVESPGRSFPIETRLLDRPWRAPGDGRRGFEAAFADLVLEALNETEGDVLAFLPGAPEIERTLAKLTPAPPDVTVLALHGSMPFRKQAHILRRTRGGQRRVILSTAIAETSLTVPGVRVVVDGGLARRVQTDLSTGLTRLVTETVSRAQADQRRGRAGRLGPGICYRLWTKGENGALNQFPRPEILETDIAPLVLQLALWGVTDPASMKFLDPPSDASVHAARELLQKLSALDQDGRITTHGRVMATRPLHPRLAHMLVTAEDEDLGLEAGLLAALLSERDPITGEARRNADLGERLSAILDPRTASADRGRCDRIRAEAKRLVGGLPSLKSVRDAAGVLLARAYPDRVALARDPNTRTNSAKSTDTCRYLLANGRGAHLAAHDPMAKHRFLVPTDLEDGGEARIRLAASISHAEIRTIFADQIREERAAAWSARTETVEARRRERFGALVLSDKAWRDAPPELLASALTEGIRSKGIRTLPWSDSARLFQARIEWLASQTSETELPDSSDQGLETALEEWLTPHLAGMSRISDVAKLDLATLLRARLDWRQQKLVDEAAPPVFVTPLGRKASVDYSRASPTISVKVQELFGVTHHPTVGHRPVALMIELLSPAGRPVQRTSDLPGFWASSYRDVAKEMRARYPKHPWPDNPAEAAPTTRIRSKSR